ncbi:hypothetical protein KUM39_01100 [Streptomyces sp. J2-1]|uniref:hypothetical protein n=1 Tax=Streptomyces corallincola TaxID=2851888 RepID=UPI001C3853CA|nr:hypothetical protein [Streptomyces corallincola]MBV2352965.1 hypothetical protein [Streptomyces corallincola]
MRDWEIPDGAGLSQGERLTLAQIETALADDREFSARMRAVARTGAPSGAAGTPPPGPGPHVARAHPTEGRHVAEPAYLVERRRRRDRWLPLAVLLLALASVLVAVLGIRTSDRIPLWCFAVLWPLTMFQAYRLLRRTVRGRRSRGRGGSSTWR